VFQLLAAARDMNIDGNAVADALGDEAEVFVERFAAIELGRVGAGEARRQIDVDRVDSKSP
jgi:hypothetical protein